eukprot:7934641-Alexandrium_andersonii.AAC.1
MQLQEAAPAHACIHVLGTRVSEHARAQHTEPGTQPGTQGALRKCPRRAFSTLILSTAARSA